MANQEQEIAATVECISKIGIGAVDGIEGKRQYFLQKLGLFVPVDRRHGWRQITWASDQNFRTLPSSMRPRPRFTPGPVAEIAGEKDAIPGQQEPLSYLRFGI